MALPYCTEAKAESIIASNTKKYYIHNIKAVLNIFGLSTELGFYLLDGCSAPWELSNLIKAQNLVGSGGYLFVTDELGETAGGIISVLAVTKAQSREGVDITVSQYYNGAMIDNTYNFYPEYVTSLEDEVVEL